MNTLRLFIAFTATVMKVFRNLTSDRGRRLHATGLSDGGVHIIDKRQSDFSGGPHQEVVNGLNSFQTANREDIWAPMT